MSDMPIEAIEDTPVEVTNAAARMRAAREVAGMSLKDIASTTRVPLRHLQALEEGDYGSLPGMTYCAGFARSYARAVGLDEVALVADIRREIGEAGGLGQDAYEFEEAVNPARIPPGRLALAAAIITLLIAGGYGLWRMQLTTPPTDDQIAAQSMDEAAQAAQQGVITPATPPPAAPPAGPVVMTAADDVWMRIYQPDGTRLFEGTLKRGESYTVPDNARDPMILTGRPDALAVTVGGQAVPPLGTAEKTISDVPISSAALLGRAQASADNATAPVMDNMSVPAPVTAATPRPAPRNPAASPASGVAP
jgi:cytoskeleton protein RodZ